jgi:hypothetical protein
VAAAAAEVTRLALMDANGGLAQHARRLQTVDGPGFGSVSLLAGLLVAALLGGAAPLVAAHAAGKPPASAAVPVAASPASADAGKNTLAAIVEASAEQDAFEAAVRHHLPGAARTDAWASDVRDQQAAFAALECRSTTANQTWPSGCWS